MTTSAFISGSFDRGNLGDESLLDSFLFNHARAYHRVHVLSAGDPLRGGSEPLIAPPTFATGRRFWRGAWSRWRVASKLRSMAPSYDRDLVLLGGLLGDIAEHVRVRVKELEWSRRFATRIVYYFGDVDQGFERTRDAFRLVDILNSRPTWIAVRSQEAADVLRHCGLSRPTFVGVDPVLHKLSVNRTIPFRRLQPPTKTIGIIPCVTRGMAELRALWLSAARYARANEYKVRWISFADRDDVELCRTLARETAAEGANVELRHGLEALSALNDLSACVATRYHGAIYSLAAGIPTLAIPYGGKIRRLFELLGRPDALLKPTRIPPNGTVGEKLEAALAGHLLPEYEELAAQIKCHSRLVKEFSSSLR